MRSLLLLIGCCGLATAAITLCKYQLREHQSPECNRRKALHCCPTTNSLVFICGDCHPRCQRDQDCHLPYGSCCKNRGQNFGYCYAVRDPNDCPANVPWGPIPIPLNSTEFTSRQPKTRTSTTESPGQPKSWTAKSPEDLTESPAHGPPSSQSSSMPEQPPARGPCPQPQVSPFDQPPRVRAFCNGRCCDLFDSCPYWRQNGACQRNVEFMWPNCPVSCGWECPNDQKQNPRFVPVDGLQADDCVDYRADCYEQAVRGLCEADWSTYQNCPLSCQFC